IAIQEIVRRQRVGAGGDARDGERTIRLDVPGRLVGTALRVLPLRSQRRAYRRRRATNDARDASRSTGTDRDDEASNLVAWRDGHPFRLTDVDRPGKIRPRI